MKNRVKAVIDNKPVELISAHVQKNGTRAIDSGTFTVTRKSSVTKNSEVLYIQDVVNTKYLTGLWNFEYSTRDESGNNLDGEETDADKSEFTYVEDCEGVVIQGGSNFTKPPKIVDPRASSATDFTIDFSQQFDILALVKGDSYPRDQKMGIFGKGNATNNIDLYFTSSIGGSSNSDPNYARADIKIGGTTVSLGYGTSNASGTHQQLAESNQGGSGASASRAYYFWVRLYRDENNLVKLTVNGNLEGSATITGDPNNTDPIYLAADYAKANLMRNRLAQVRMYCGYHLSDGEYEDLIKARIPTEVCKFGGTVWKIDERPSHKIVHCKGFSDRLHNIEIKTGGVYPTWTTGDDDIFENEYKSKEGWEILADLLKVYKDELGNLTYNVVEESKWDQSYSRYLATGSLFSNILLIGMNNNSSTSFKITGRGVLLLEEDDRDHKEIIFRQGANARVKDFGFDDSNVITQLTLISDETPVKHTRNITSNDFSADGNYYTQTSNKLLGKPIDIEVIKNTSPSVNLNQLGEGATSIGSTHFRPNIQDKSITLASPLFTGSDGYTINYTYENLNDATKYYTIRSGSYSSLGLYSKTLHLPHYRGTFGLTTVATRMFTLFAKIERRISITVPHLVNNVRENYVVKVEAPQHGITSSTNLGDGDNSLTVKSLEYFYPEGRTIINLGEHQFDSFDLDKSFGEAISSQKANITRTMPSA